MNMEMADKPVCNGYTLEMVHPYTWETVVEHYTPMGKEIFNTRKAELRTLGYVSFSEMR